MTLDKSALSQFYKEEITENFWPFWEKAFDHEYGGVFTCFSNDGSKLVSTDKYTWSQGRFLWLCSELYEMAVNNDLEIDTDQLKHFAFQTYGFLRKYTILPNFNILYAVSKEGKMIEEQKDISVFADAFFILGVNKYAHKFKDRDAFGVAHAVYRSVLERVKEGSFKTEPYPIPVGYTSHSIHMILLNVTQELADTAKALGHAAFREIAEECRGYSAFIMDNLLQDDGRIVELSPKDRKNFETLLTRHSNPGHAIESVWFHIHSLPYLEREDGWLLEKCSKIVLHALQSGWDKTDDGLLRFVDKYGGVPTGLLKGSPYEKLIIDTWDTKLWWPHTEALYTTLLMYEKTGNQEFLDWYEKVSLYTFDTFPNTENTSREWIQIRDRKGKPLNKVVALPVKDPFHILRNFILIIKLLK